MDIDALRQKAVANLEYVYSGKAKKDLEAARVLRQQQKLWEKQKAKDIKAKKKYIAKLRKELEEHDELYARFENDPNPLGYMEGMTPAQHQGLMEEIDAAREGCLNEIIHEEDLLSIMENGI